MSDPDCLFCKIVAGDVPAEKVDEDEHTISFMDINPWTRGHALVIPKRHSKNLYEADPADLGHTVAAAQRLSLRVRDTLGADGVNLLNSCEPAAWQTVFHLHVHVIPRYDDDPLQLPGAPQQPADGELAAVAAELRVSAVAGYTRTADVGAITIDKPPLNLFDRELVEALERSVAAAADDAPRALIVRAEGKVFTGGVDVQEFDDLGGAAAREFASQLLALTHSIEDLPFPTLAVVHNLCLTAGLELALACDLIWAGESAKFGLVERVVGVTPFMGGTQRMAERAGPARAREFVFSGNPYPAADLERWGVVNRVVADDGLHEAALEFATHLAAGPPHAHAATKRIVRAQVDRGTRAADEVTPGEAERLFETEDLKRAVKTFLAEGPGKATFTGG